MFVKWLVYYEDEKKNLQTVEVDAWNILEAAIVATRSVKIDNYFQIYQITRREQ